MKCKRCGAEMPDAKRTFSECGAFLEGYTLNNVTGEYGYRGADGGWYKSEEEYRAHCSCATHSDAIDTEKIAFRLPDWSAGTEVVCYCRSTDSHDAIEQIAQQRQWKIVKYVHIDELPIVNFYKPGQVVLAKREALEWKYKPTPIELSTWRDQMLGGLRPSDWDKFIVR